jgi:hypothetical protein
MKNRMTVVLTFGQKTKKSRAHSAKGYCNTGTGAKRRIVALLRNHYTPTLTLTKNVCSDSYLKDFA